jgi:hypothetical protein
MEWANEIPGLSFVVEAFLSTRAGGFVLDNREWLFDGIGVTVFLSILAGVSAALRVVLGLSWSLCCLSGRGIAAGYEWQSERRLRKLKQGEENIESDQSDNEPAEQENKETSSLISPTPAEISHIMGMGPGFDPYSHTPTRSTAASAHYGAAPGIRDIELPGYSSWPRYFGFLAKLLVLAAAINAAWIVISTIL